MSSLYISNELAVIELREGTTAPSVSVAGTVYHRLDGERYAAIRRAMSASPVPEETARRFDAIRRWAETHLDVPPEPAPAIALRKRLGWSELRFQLVCQDLFGRPGPSTCAEDDRVVFALLGLEPPRELAAVALIAPASDTGHLDSGTTP